MTAFVVDPAQLLAFGNYLVSDTQVCRSPVARRQRGEFVNEWRREERGGVDSSNGVRYCFKE